MNIRNLLIVIAFLGFYSLNRGFAQNDRKIDSLNLLIDKADSNIEKIDLVLSLAEIYRSQIPSEAISISLEMKDMSDSLLYKEGQYLSRRLLAQSYAGLSDFREAIKYVNQAKTFLDESTKPYEDALLERVLGVVYSGLGELDKASDCYFRSLHICEELDNKACQSSSYNGIGDLFFERKDYKMALKYYSMALEISRELNDLEGVSRGLNNISIVFASNNEGDKALPLLFEASEINSVLGKRLWEGINYLNIAENYRTQKNFEKSLPFYLKADSIFSELEHYVLKAKNYISISKYYFDLNDMDHSLEYANKAFDI
jgi:tetratricopeptide (TPR) repeat protein